MCPPVPPPAIISIPRTPCTPMNEVSSARLLRQVQQDSDCDETGDQRRSAVTDERQRQSFRWQQTKSDADIEQRLDGDHQRETERRVEIEAVLAEARHTKTAPDEKREDRHQRKGADEAELLADDRENEVGVRLRQEKELLPAVADAQPAQSSGADRDQRLHRLEPFSQRIGFRIQEREEPVAPVGSAENQQQARGND